jgi:hypothetical protein
LNGFTKNLEMAMQKPDIAPSWFLEILIAWGAWSSGSVVNLKPRTFWQDGGVFNYSATEEDIDKMEMAVKELRVLNFHLAAILEYRYLASKPRTVLDIERHFRISTASARQQLLAGEMCLCGIYSRYRNAA